MRRRVIKCAFGEVTVWFPCRPQVDLYVKAAIMCLASGMV